MVAEFPTFSKVTLEDKQFFDEFNAQFPPYADWAFGTLMTWWDASDDLEASRLGGNLVIKSSYLTMGKTSQFVLLGTDDVDSAIEAIFNFQQQNDLPCELYSLPQYTIDSLKNPERFVIVDDLGAAEYIFSTESLSKMEGGNFQHMRQGVRRFENSVGDRKLSVSPIPLDTLPAKLMLINALHTWQGVYKNDRELLEGATIDRTLIIAEHIGIKSLCAFIDNTMIGFILYKALHDGYVNINHIKVSRDYPDLFRYMTHSIAKFLQTQGITHLNGEQDLNIEGLRRYKTSLQPVKMLHKYNIYPR